MTLTDATPTAPTARPGPAPASSSDPADVGAAASTDPVAEARLDAAHGFRTLRETGTLPDGGAVVAVERIPGVAEPLVLADPDPAPEGVDVAALQAILRADDELTTVVDIRSPNLVAWALTGRTLPIRYVPVQRWTLGREIPVRTDPDQPLADFAAAARAADLHVPAVLDAGGGAIVWGRKGLLRTLEYVQLVEEGAQFQILAEPLGGSRPVGPGVLLQQWRMSGLEEAARAAGLL